MPPREFFWHGVGVKMVTKDARICRNCWMMKPLTAFYKGRAVCKDCSHMKLRTKYEEDRGGYSGPVQCPDCDKSFPTGRHLGGHAKSHPFPVKENRRKRESGLR